MSAVRAFGAGCLRGVAMLIVTGLAVLLTLTIGPVLLLNELTYRALGVTRQRCRPVTVSPTSSATASIVILNWNGKELLAENLPSVIEAVRHDGAAHEIIVVDNGSVDGSVEFVRQTFPGVRVVALERNTYFSRGNNAGAQAAGNDIIVFLNNDMYVDASFLRPLLRRFSEPDVFAVTAQVFLRDETAPRVETGKTRGAWRQGRFDLRHELPTERDLRRAYGPVLWCGGGSSAVDRRKFLEIGGFDTLMDPFYFEDTDLSYQAWKRGWRVLFSPESVVWHQHRASSRRFGERYVERTIQRNRLLFVWKNVTDPLMLASHVAWLPWTLLRLTRQLTPLEATQTIVSATLRFPMTLRRRNRCRKHYRLKDKDVISATSSAFDYRRLFETQRGRRPGPMRVLFVCPYLPSLLHAGGVRMLQMIQRLGERADVSVIAFSDNENERRYIEDLERACSRVEVVRRRQNPMGVDWLRRVPRVISVHFSDPGFRDRLREVLGDDDYDVVQCEYIQMAGLLPESRHEVAILTDYEVQHAAARRRLEREVGGLRRLSTWMEWLRWLNAESRLCRKFDLVVALTKEDARALATFEPTLRVEVIPMGVDTDYYRPLCVPEEHTRLVFVGNFRHAPNVDGARYLIDEILPRVREHVPDACVDLIGIWPTQEIVAQGQRPGVTVTGWIDDLRPHMAKAGVIVAPLRLGAGMRGKVLEGLAMAKGVVATSVACAGIDARDGEHVAIADTPEDFASRVVALVRDRALCGALGRNGRALVEERYSWPIVVAKQLELYETLVTRSPGRGPEVSRAAAGQART